MIVKKYANRRLYDPEDSRYITLEELADAVRAGIEPQVVDAQTGLDLTQATLAQIILEGRGASKLLPVPLLLQLIRMGDDALAEFFSRYVAWALEVYVRARSASEQVQQWNPWVGGALTHLGRLAPNWPFWPGEMAGQRPHGQEHGRPPDDPMRNWPVPPWTQADAERHHAPAQPKAQPEPRYRPEPKPPAPDDPFAALRQELAELRAQVAAKKPRKTATKPRNK